MIRFLVIQHHRENRKKCSLTPILHRPDLEVEVLRPGPAGYAPIDIDGGILLEVDAPPLEPADRALLEGPRRKLVLLDGNWVKVPLLHRCLRPREPLAARSLPATVATAYPRRSKLFRDPPGGLATVEAMAAALAVLGAPDLTLLEGYHWADRFLELNRALFSGALFSGAVISGAVLPGALFPAVPGDEVSGRAARLLSQPPPARIE